MNQIPTREILWNIPNSFVLALYLFSALAIMFLFYWYYNRKLLHTKGSILNQGEKGTKSQYLLNYLLGHKILLKDPYAGVMHLFIFWGFLILVVATTLVAIQHHLHIVFLVGTPYLIFSLISDLGGVIFCLGLTMSLWRRRNVSSHGRLMASKMTNFMIWLMIVLSLSGFILEALRIATDFPAHAPFSPVGYVMALGLKQIGIHGTLTLEYHKFFWAFHAILVIFFFILLPSTFMKHLVFAAINVWKGPTKVGILGLTNAPLTEGTKWNFFAPRDLLQADACLTCGRCSEVCPAKEVNKPLDPRSIILGLRENLNNKNSLIQAFISDDSLWSCTTCHACDSVCPIHINVMEKIVHLRRGKIAESEIGENVGMALESSAQKFNPFGRPNSERTQWAQGLKVPVVQESEEEIELLYWVGCAGSFDANAQETSKSMVKIFEHLEINFKILGCQERCTGDPARRLGEEDLWREMATHNLNKFAHHKIKTIITHCPHCFNSFKNEYPAIGPVPTIIHHTQWLQKQLESGALTVKKISGEKFTYHDPCYLARAGKETSAPRKVLQEVFDNPLIEMKKNKENTSCCGGGGGQLWLEGTSGDRIEEDRALQVHETSAKTVVTGCPFCKEMLGAGKDQLPEGKNNWMVKDLAQIVAQSIQREGAL